MISSTFNTQRSRAIRVPTLVRAQAVVDPANTAADYVLRWADVPSGVLILARRPPDPPQWAVTVRGLPPHATERVFLILAPDDTVAAHEGLRLFQAEMEAGVAIL